MQMVTTVGLDIAKSRENSFATQSGGKADTGLLIKGMSPRAAHGSRARCARVALVKSAPLPISRFTQESPVVPNLRPGRSAASSSLELGAARWRDREKSHHGSVQNP